MGGPQRAAPGLKGLDVESLEAVVAHNPEGILLTDGQGAILAANPAACAILGATEEEICRRGTEGFLDRRDPHWRSVLKARAMTGRFRAELPMMRADGSSFVALIASNTFVLSGGRSRECVSFRDISDRAAFEQAQDQLVEELEELSGQDELTGLLNRRGFTVAGRQLLRVADRLGAVIHALFIDVDGLKRINDEQGHDAGDSALALVADVLRQTARSSDVIGRLGGDEFGVVLLGSGARGTETFIRRTADLLADRSHGAVTLSIGTADRPPGSGLDLRELLKMADMRMYEGRRLRRR